MNKTAKKIAVFLLILSLNAANIISAFAQEFSIPNETDVSNEMVNTANYLKSAILYNGIGIFNYKELILLTQSGIDCKELTKSYLELISNSFVDGQLEISDANNTTMYSAILIILALNGMDATNFNGHNIIQLLNDEIKSFHSSDELYNEVNNPYYYEYIIYALFSYKTEFDSSDFNENIEKVQNAFLKYYSSDDFGCGINYYGFSADNNNACLAALNKFSSNDEIKSKISDALSYCKSLILEDGGTKYNNASYSTSSNANSTGSALYLYSSMNMEKEASISYNGLMNFKSKETTGCYTYYGVDNLYSTLDAFKGLVAYWLYQNNKENILDVQNEVKSIYHKDEAKEEALESTTANDKEQNVPAQAPEESTLKNPSTSNNLVVESTAKNQSPNTSDVNMFVPILIMLCSISCICIVNTKKFEAK